MIFSLLHTIIILFNFSIVSLFLSFFIVTFLSFGSFSSLFLSLVFHSLLFLSPLTVTLSLSIILTFCPFYQPLLSISLPLSLTSAKFFLITSHISLHSFYYNLNDNSLQAQPMQPPPAANCLSTPLNQVTQSALNQALSTKPYTASRCVLLLCLPSFITSATPASFVGR